ncbi:D-glucuronyl C5-epimerase family protein [Shinella zoogloeoides]|uniref:D-glucuronyl C5-epimerase C-terminal domain-containing protein n=1 Tax=Shinella zoogloeoides TaxID=352475 RepID=A0A6N8TNK5_SHIZO|nr:D-glucuronyl C5-epimerase family protein [Shinella zoogloeoides]MXO02720.1 hypothetical protein [Shinella zoogloeoides]UEX81830.1 D-glucuronyl C5-epimerase family protein [Shinella zoogloeoides]
MTAWFRLALAAFLAAWTFCFSTLAFADAKLRGLQMFYGDVTHAFGTETTPEVTPCVAPRIGWQSEGKSCLDHPTKVASDGLLLILRGNRAAAAEHGQWLLDHAEWRHRGLFFPFQWDLVTFWPYEMKAPWVSGLTQGLAVGLFSYLYEATGEARWADAARTTYRSYLVDKDQGGFAGRDTDGVTFEEYPTEPATHVLNGSAVAAIALHDYARIFADDDALKLFDEATRWYENNIERYTLASSTHRTIISRYSLAPKRAEVLFRIVGAAKAKIHTLELRSDDEVIARLDIGSDGDDTMSSPTHIWNDPAYQNWGEKDSEGDETFRRYIPDQGEYNHAPFTFTIPEGVEHLSLYIEAAIEDNRSLDVQFYTGAEYMAIGQINGAAPTFTFPLGESIRAASVMEGAKPAVNPQYWDDNFQLAKILGTLSSSKPLTRVANSWRQSAQLVPFAALPDHKFEWIDEATPVLDLVPNSQESRHVEYPSVITTPDGKRILYSAIGEDGRWRIYLATSQMGENWTRQGQIFDDGTLPFTGNYAFPNVIAFEENGARRYTMVFAAASKASVTYDTLYLSHSSDGAQWSAPQAVLRDLLVLDPLLMRHPDGGFEVFYVVNEGSVQAIMSARSPDGTQWTAANSVWASRGAAKAGIYTIGGVVHKDVQLFLLEEMIADERHVWNAYCRDFTGAFIKLPGNPLHIDASGNDSPMLYGMAFENNTELGYVYYNEISALGAETGGVIRKSRVEPDELGTLDLQTCAKSGGEWP